MTHKSSLERWLVIVANSSAGVALMYGIELAKTINNKLAFTIVWLSA